MERVCFDLERWRPGTRPLQRSWSARGQRLSSSLTGVARLQNGTGILLLPVCGERRDGVERSTIVKYLPYISIVAPVPRSTTRWICCSGGSNTSTGTRATGSQRPRDLTRSGQPVLSLRSGESIPDSFFSFSTSTLCNKRRDQRNVNADSINWIIIIQLVYLHSFTPATN